MSIPRPLHIILDFDGTITTKDTIEPLVQTALSLKHRSRSPSSGSQKNDSIAWDNCKEMYLSDLSRHYDKAGRVSGAGLEGSSRTLEGEEKFLGGLRAVEEKSVKRVSKAGIFEGVTPGMLRQMAGEEADVVVREGFGDFVAEMERRGLGWGLVSVNWSREWIRGVLDGILGDAEQVDTVPVMANEIDPATGRIEGCRLDVVCSPLSSLYIFTALGKSIRTLCLDIPLR